MNVGSVIKRVRSIAGDSAVLQFTDSDVIDWLNDGIRECAIQNHLLQKNASNTTTPGVSEYNIPTDILRLHSVTVGGLKLRSQTLQEWQEFSGDVGADEAQGRPTDFYVWATKLRMWPTPTESLPFVIAYTYKPVELEYNGSDAGIADTDTNNQALGIPTEYHTRLVDYCLAQVAQQDGSNDLYQLKMQEFITGVSQLKDKPEVNEDLYPSISVSSRDAGYYD
jgi:hypothetical protein